MARKLPIATNILSTRARPENKFYIAILYQPETNLLVRAWVPETFHLRIQNEWEPLFGNPSEAGGVSRLLRMLGMPINIKALTQLIWLGSLPLEFEFTFMFDTYRDTWEDVELPIRRLIMMSTPTRSNWRGNPDPNGYFLAPPGPTLISNERRIYLRVGRMFFLDSVVIHNVDVQWYTVSDKQGGYMAADVNVTLSTAYTPDQHDIMKFFDLGKTLSDDMPDELIKPYGPTIQDAWNAFMQWMNGVKDEWGLEP